jgi:competence protein ComEC
MMSVVNNFRPREMWLSGMPKPEELTAIVARAKEIGTLIRELKAGDEFDWEGVHVRVLAPKQDGFVDDERLNNQSLAMTMSYLDRGVLLEGDSEKRAEQEIAGQHPGADLLKVAHNGSLTSTSAELLDAVHPSVAFISAGSRNPFHHPRTEVLARLADREIQAYRTDTMGALTFLIDKAGVRYVEQQP